LNAEGEVRALLLGRLMRIAERLPNGLLTRLVSDAQFFYDWNLKKKSARKSARISQYKSLQSRQDEEYWKQIRKMYL
jgi:hypothetical protein